MTSQALDATKITKPIQLVAAWLVGLVTINGSFLLAAAQISTPWWLSTLLVSAAIANVPLFLFCIYRLQTKYRTQMQEDQYDAKYLERSDGTLPARTQDPMPLDEKSFEAGGPVNLADKV